MKTLLLAILTLLALLLVMTLWGGGGPAPGGGPGQFANLPPDRPGPLTIVDDLPPERTGTPTIRCPIVPEREEGTIVSLAFSPDGKALAARNQSGKLRIYDADTALPLTLHPVAKLVQGGANFIAFAPDGRVLVGGDDRKMALIDLVTGRRVREFEPYPPTRVLGLGSLGFSPDKKTLASGCGEVVVWEVARGRRVHVLPPYIIPAHTTGPANKQVQALPAAITSLAFSPDSATLYTAGGIVRAWDVASGQERPRFDKPTKDFLSRIAVTADGATVVAGHNADFFGRPQRTIELWDAATGRKRSDLATIRGITQMSLLRGSQTLVTLEAENVVCLWDIASGKRLDAVRFDHRLYAECMAVSSDGKRIAIGGDEGAMIFGVIQLIDTDGVTLTPRPSKP